MARWERGERRIDRPVLLGLALAGLVVARGVAPLAGAALRQRRLQLSYTQGDLAEALDVHLSTITRWEDNSVQCERPQMLALALEGLGRLPRPPRQHLGPRYVAQVAALATTGPVTEERLAAQLGIAAHSARRGLKRARRDGYLAGEVFGTWALTPAGERVLRRANGRE